MADIEKARVILDERQKQDLALLETAGAKLQRISFTTKPSLEYRLAFPKSLLVEEEVLCLTEEKGCEGSSLTPARWSVRSVLDGVFSQKPDPENIRLGNPLFSTMYSLDNYGFRIREKVEVGGKRSLAVQFPGFDPDSKFHPNLILQATAEGYPNGWQVLPKTKTPEEQAQESFTTVMKKHQDFVGGIGIVQACLVGMKPGFRTGYIWNILSEDFTFRQMQQDSRFTQLSTKAAKVIADSKDHMPMRMANVLPVKAGKLFKRYEQNGHELVTIGISDTEAFLNGLSSRTHRQTSLDILIGGLQNYSERLKRVREIAEQAEKDFGEGFEEAFRLDLSGKRIKDKRARALLIDIALARNTSLTGGFARAFEMLAEPTRVMQAIVEDIFNDQVVASITELDIQGAIEANALVCEIP